MRVSPKSGVDKRENLFRVIKSKTFRECEYRFGDCIVDKGVHEVFKFHLCRANGQRKCSYLAYQINYSFLMPNPNDPQQLLWKSTKRELTALDIIASDHVI